MFHGLYFSFFADQCRQMHIIIMGSQNTGYDLHCHIYRLVPTKHRVILQGKELKLSDEPSRSLKDLGINDAASLLIYIQEPLPDLSSTQYTSGPAQPDAMENFEALYMLLDLPESLSYPVCIPSLPCGWDTCLRQSIGVDLSEKLSPTWSSEETAFEPRHNLNGHISSR